MIDLIRTILKSEGKELMQARQFFKDQKPWPEGVYVGYDSPYKHIRKEIYLLNTPDGLVEILEGDWIVKTTEEKNYYVRIKPEPVE